MLLDFGVGALQARRKKSFIISFTQREREKITPDPDWRRNGHPLQDISNPN